MSTAATTATICLTADTKAFDAAMKRCLANLKAFEKRAAKVGVKIGAKGKLMTKPLRKVR